MQQSKSNPTQLTIRRDILIFDSNLYILYILYPNL